LINAYSGATRVSIQRTFVNIDFTLYTGESWLAGASEFCASLVSQTVTIVQTCASWAYWSNKCFWQALFEFLVENCAC